MLHEVAEFSTVCTDVLHRCSTSLARDGRKVLCSIEAVTHSPCHHIVPYLASTHSHSHLGICLVDDVNPLDLAMEYDTVEVAREKDVTALPDVPYLMFPALDQFVGEYHFQPFDRIVFAKDSCLDINAERVPAKHRRIGCDCNHI